VAAENIDGTVNGSGFFPTKVPGLSDAADIQAALRLYHYGSYAYDGSNTTKASLVNPSIAKHLQDLVDAIDEEITNRDIAIADAIDGATGAYSDLAGNGIEWNSVDDRFDIHPRIFNIGTAITKSASFTLEQSDVSKTILLSASTPMTLTIPANSSVAIPVGYQYNFVEIGTERTTFSPAAGVTIGSKNSQLFLDGRYSKGSLVKISTNEWVLFGDIYEGVATPTPTPVAPTPTPVSPTPTPVTPTPTPVTPTPTPVTPTPTPVTPTPTSTTTYWATGCCLGATTNRQVTGTSTDNAIAAANIAINDCSGSGETLENIQEGSYTTTNNIPTLTCTAPPTPVGPTVYDIYTYCDPVFPAMRGGAYGTQSASSTTNVGTTTNASLSSEQIVALLGYGSGCPTVPAPTPVAPTPTPVTPTPVAPTPVATCTDCLGYTPNADGSYGTRSNTDCASGSEYYRVCVTPGGCTNITTTGGCVPVTPTPTPASTPTPVAPPPAPPSPVAPVPTTVPVPTGGGCVPGDLCDSGMIGNCIYIYTYTASCGCSLSSTVC